MPPRTGRPDVIKEFEERVISIDRVARVVRGGRRFRFRTTVVIGDGKGRVGVGVGKGSEVVTSITKAVAIAKKNMITVEMRGTSIPHQVQVRFCGAEVLLKPASEGTGVIAGGAVRSVVEAAGIHDLLTKSFGSTNKVNNAYAAIMALGQLKPTKASSANAKATPVVKVAEPAPATVETVAAETPVAGTTASKAKAPASKKAPAKTAKTAASKTTAVKKPAAKKPATKSKGAGK